MLPFDLSILPTNNRIQRFSLSLHESVQEMFKDFSPYKAKNLGILKFEKDIDHDWTFTYIGSLVVKLQNFCYSLTCKTNTIMNYHIYKDDIHIGYRTTIKELQELLAKEIKIDQENNDYFEKKYGRKMRYSSKYRIRVTYYSYFKEKNFEFSNDINKG